MQEYENIQAFEKLLKEFSTLSLTDFPEYKPTYLELCQYPGNRFEEICSRIFDFFFNPGAVHGFSNLFLTSFLECLPEFENTDNLAYESSVLEDVTENQKRIDITLVLKDRVICIENKIFASLYNELDEYKNHIDKKYVQKNTKQFVVLSLKELDADEKEKCQKTGFAYVRYQEFFDRINVNLGSYVQDCDQRYLAYLLDFMKTIQNKGRFMTDYNQFCDSKKYQFYYENSKELEKLKFFTENMKKEIDNLQRNVLQDFLNYVKGNTESKITEWGKDGMCIMHYKKDSNLGIEFSFDISEKNICDKIYFIITEWLDWSKMAWNSYGDKIKKQYPNGEYKECDNVYCLSQIPLRG